MEATELLQRLITINKIYAYNIGVQYEQTLIIIIIPLLFSLLPLLQRVCVRVM